MKYFLFKDKEDNRFSISIYEENNEVILVIERNIAPGWYNVFDDYLYVYKSCHYLNGKSLLRNAYGDEIIDYTDRIIKLLAFQ